MEYYGIFREISRELLGLGNDLNKWFNYVKNLYNVFFFFDAVREKRKNVQDRLGLGWINWLKIKTDNERNRIRWNAESSLSCTFGRTAKSNLNMTLFRETMQTLDINLQTTFVTWNSRRFHLQTIQINKRACTASGMHTTLIVVKSTGVYNVQTLQLPNLNIVVSFSPRLRTI